MSRRGTATAAMTAFVVTCPLVVILVYRWWQSRCEEKKIEHGQSEDKKIVDESSAIQPVDISVGTARVTQTTSNHEFLSESHETEIEETVSCATVDCHLYAQPSTEEIFQEFDPSTNLSNLIGKDASEIMASASTHGLNFPFLLNQKTLDYIGKPESKVMFVMRGLSGSGKSTIVDHIKSIFRNVVVCSADHFFYRKDGTYDFNADKLATAHGTCQQRAREACGKGSSIVVIDNTNVKRWEMKPYLETAKHNGYVVILVEPKTPWKLDAKELAKRNKHGVDLNILQRKVKIYDEVIPLYYAWFLNETSSRHLLDLSDHLFKECLKLFPDFRRTLLQQAPDCGSKRESVEEVLSRYYDRAGQSSPLLHCTSHFCNHGKIPDAKEYHQRKDVQKSCGQVYTLKVSGLTLTRNTLGARISLDVGCTSLYRRPEEDDWKGMKIGSRFREARETKKDKSPKSKTKKVLKSSQASKRGGSGNEYGDDVSTQLSKVSLGDRNEFDEEGATSRRDADLIPLTELFPGLHNTGHARSAHITLKTSKGVESKETNFDVLSVCDIEQLNFRSQNQPTLFSVQKGKACYYDDGICCVYFQPPIDLDALFSGYYG